MAVTKSEVAKLYVAMFNRAPDSAGLDYWVASGLSIEQICMSFFDQPETAALYPTTTTNEAFVTAIYSNLFNREPDAAGLTYWVDQLTAGTVSRSVMVLAVVNGAQDTVDHKDATIVANKTTVGLYYADKGLDGTFSVSDIDETASTVNSAMTTIDSLAGTDPDTDIPGEIYSLTDGRDTVTGTANNDTFYGFVGQNAHGALANGFATGDVINGGTGTDTLYATLMNDRTTQDGSAYDINGRTSNLEIAKFEILDEGVVVDAGAMDSVKEFWSVNSDDTGLTLEDVRLGTKLSITKDITFVMQDVDYGSDLTVGFDSNSFKAVGEKTFNSRIVIEVGDSNKPADSTNPLELITLGLKFTYDGTTYTMTGIKSADGTYAGLMAAISSALADKGLTNLIVQFGDALSEIEAENDTVPLLYAGAKQIIITDPSGVDFEDFQSSIGSDFGGGASSNPVSNTYAEDPASASGLIESNLVLDNAGRGSTAGTVQIGAMSNSNAGIQQFNVFVDHSSAIAELTTTNGKLKNVYIDSREVDSTDVGAKGDLEIGTITGYGTNYLELIDASGFEGTNLMLGATVEGGNTAGEIDEHGDTNAQADIINVKTLNANIAANVTFNAATSQDALTDTDTYMTYTTGSGKDTIDVELDGDSVDSEGEGLTINANSGDNTVTVKTITGVEHATMALLDNLDITTTSGTDKVTNIGIADFDISVGDASDMVYIDSIDATGITAGAAKGTWTVSAADETTVTPTWDTRVLYHATLTVNFAGFEQTVEIATTAANHFVATQMDINNAIKAAIAANPELARLLTTTDTTSSEQLVITSLVEGANDLTIDVFQPTAIHTGTAAVRQVLVATADVSALRLGLIETLDMHTADNTTAGTYVADDSEDVETAEEIAYIMNSTIADGAGVDSARVIAGNSGDGHLTAAGIALDGATGSLDDTTAYNFLAHADGTDGADETSVTNFSSIDMGNGANDLVVLSSNAASANTLVFSNTWGKVSVVNFFDANATGNGEDGIANIAAITPDEDTELSDASMGLHVIDFTKWLDDKIDTSINTGGNALDSIVRVGTTDVVVAANALAVTEANQVVIVNDFEKGDTNNTENWAGLTATTLQATLNGTASGTAATGWGNLFLNAGHAIVENDTDDLIDGITDVTTADTAKIDSVFMIENDDNQGEYKVFNVEWSHVDGTVAGSQEVAVVTLLGTVDCGESIDATAVFA